MTASYWQRLAPRESSAEVLPQELDVAIIGAGFTGASIAYWARELMPNARIGLFDRAYSGSGASGQNAGFLTTGSIHHLVKLRNEFGIETATNLWSLMRANRELLHARGLLPESSERCGSVSFRIGVHDWKDAVEIYKQMNWPLKHLSRKEIEQRFGARGVIEGFFDADEWKVNPLEMLKSVIGSHDVFSHSPIDRYEPHARGWLLSIGATTVLTKTLFVCAHHESLNLLKVFDDGVSIVENDVAHLRVSHPFTSQVYVPELKAYLRPLSHQDLLIGGLRNLSGENLSERIEKHLFVHFPFLAYGEQLHQWRGTLLMKADYRPIAAISERNLYGLFCYSGHGLGLSFISARALIESLVHSAPLPTWLEQRPIGT